MYSGRLSLTALLILLAACGPVPKPFQQTEGDKIANPLVSIPDGAGITVAPVAGTGVVLSGALTEALVGELQSLGIPATAGAALTNGLLMQGWTAWVDDTVRVVWDISDRNGATLATVEARTSAGLDDFLRGDPAMIDGLARRSAVIAATALRPDVVLPDGDGRPPTVAVVGVEGAPGDGDKVLPRAMTAMLDRAGIDLVDDAGNADLLLMGSVALEPVGETAERVTIEWRLLDADGNVLGKLSQSNQVPKGALDKRWGGAAYDAALANVQAIQEILERLDKIRELQRQATGGG